jgi:hypothetical protein
MLGAARFHFAVELLGRKSAQFSVGPALADVRTRARTRAHAHAHTHTHTHTHTRTHSRSHARTRAGGCSISSASLSSTSAAARPSPARSHPPPTQRMTTLCVRNRRWYLQRALLFRAQGAIYSLSRRRRCRLRRRRCRRARTRRSPRRRADRVTHWHPHNTRTHALARTPTLAPTHVRPHTHSTRHSLTAHAHMHTLAGATPFARWHHRGLMPVVISIEPHLVASRTSLNRTHAFYGVFRGRIRGSMGAAV